MIRRNPCRIEGAATGESPEREIDSLPVVFAIADALPGTLVVALLLGTLCQAVNYWALFAARSDCADRVVATSQPALHVEGPSSCGVGPICHSHQPYSRQAQFGSKVSWWVRVVEPAPKMRHRRPEKGRRRQW
jgi:hypothetical protein